MRVILEGSGGVLGGSWGDLRTSRKAFGRRRSIICKKVELGKSGAVVLGSKMGPQVGPKSDKNRHETRTKIVTKK